MKGGPFELAKGSAELLQQQLLQTLERAEVMADSRRGSALHLSKEVTGVPGVRMPQGSSWLMDWKELSLHLCLTEILGADADDIGHIGRSSAGNTRFMSCWSPQTFICCLCLTPWKIPPVSILMSYIVTAVLFLNVL